MEIAEDNLLLRIRKTAYESCEAQVKTIEQRIVSAKRDIANIEKEVIRSNQPIFSQLLGA